MRVISDVDDTLLAGRNDPIFPNGTLYPGAVSFLARCGQVGVGHAPITILTARPEGRFGVMENMWRRALAARGVPTATMLSGSVRRALGHKSIVAGKAVNLGNLLALHPKDRLVLVGDTGQGDVALARQALDNFPDRVLAAFIHMVIPSRTTLRTDKSGIVFFGTYVEAAMRASELGLLSEADVASVVADSRVELAGVKFRTPEKAAAAKMAFDEAVEAFEVH